MLFKNVLKRIWPWLYFKIYPSLAVLNAVTEALEKVGKPEEVTSETFKKKVGLDAIRESWESFYKEYFKIKIDLSRVRFPKFPSTDDGIEAFPVIVVPGLTITKILKVMNSKKLRHGIFGGFTVKSNIDFDKLSIINEREASAEPYAIIFINTDSHPLIGGGIENQSLEYMNRNLNSLYKQKIPFATLMEQLLFDLKYNVDKLRYLDHRYPGTICLGTKIKDSSVWDESIIENHTPFIHVVTVGKKIMTQTSYTAISMRAIDNTDEFGLFKIIV